MITRRKFLIWVSHAIFVISGCTYRKAIQIKYEDSGAFVKSLDELEEKGHQQVTIGWVEWSSFVLLFNSLSEDGIRKAYIEDLVLYAHEVLKNTKAIIASKFTIIPSVPYNQQKRLEHNTVIVNWREIGRFRDYVESTPDRELSEKVIILMKELFGDDYHLIENT
jgi:hypothetical protein